MTPATSSVGATKTSAILGGSAWLMLGQVAKGIGSSVTDLVTASVFGPTLQGVVRIVKRARRVLALEQSRIECRHGVPSTYVTGGWPGRVFTGFVAQVFVAAGAVWLAHLTGITFKVALTSLVSFYFLAIWWSSHQLILLIDACLTDSSLDGVWRRHLADAEAGPADGRSRRRTGDVLLGTTGRAAG